MERQEHHASQGEPPVIVRGPGPRPGPPRQTRHIILAHVLLVLTFLVYAGSLNNRFVLRDEATIVGNRWVRSLSEAPGFFRPAFWRSEMGGVLSGYKPVALVSYAADFAFWRRDALGFHLTNLFLHGLAAVVFFFLARRLVRDDGLAFLGGVLFAFHPLSTEAVCYLSVRPTLLAWFMTLGAWLAWWRSWQEGPRGKPTRRPGRWYLAALALHVLGLGSGPAAAVLPLLQLATLVLALRTEGRRRLPWLGPVPFGLLSAGALLLYAWGAQAPPPLFAEGGAPGPLFARLGGAALFAARLVFVPVNLVAGRPLSGVGPLWAVVLLLGGAGLVWLALRLGWPRTLFAAAVLGLAMTQALAEVLLRGQAYGEHRLYGATAGFALVVVALVYEASPGVRTLSLGRFRLHHPALAALFAMGLAFASVTAKRHMAWEDSRSIAQATLRSWPDNVALRSYLGRLWVEAGDLPRAEALLAGLRKDAPGSAKTLLLEGEVALARGDAPQAAALLSQAARLEPAGPYAATRALDALFRAGHLDEAARLIEESQSRHPRSPAVTHARGRLAERLGRLEEALEGYRRSAALAPHREDYHLARGRAAWALGRPEEAEEAYRAALRESPASLEAYGALAELMLKQGRSKEAVFLLAPVVPWHAERPELGILLAEAWSREGDPGRAREVYLSLLKSHPDGARAEELREALGKLENDDGTAAPAIEQ